MLGSGSITTFDDLNKKIDEMTDHVGKMAEKITNIRDYSNKENRKDRKEGSSPNHNVNMH